MATEKDYMLIAAKRFILDAGKQFGIDQVTDNFIDLDAGEVRRTAVFRVDAIKTAGSAATIKEEKGTIDYSSKTTVIQKRPIFCYFDFYNVPNAMFVASALANAFCLSKFQNIWNKAGIRDILQKDIDIENRSITTGDQTYSKVRLLFQGYTYSKFVYETPNDLVEEISAHAHFTDLDPNPFTVSETKVYYEPAP